MKALVKSHALGPEPGTLGGDATSRQQIDLIRGKGKGLIILLHGVPGVGKTSTAESVAAYTHRPLFPITCGDIGQTAADVERNLEGIFLLARKWGCVLLLDEADVFLAARSPGGDGVDRNALVSVFLRTLEYYSGILFLTTNRIGSFDEAFISRIHMSLYYADLDEESTFRVWEMNLNRLERSGRAIYVNREQIEQFARDHWRDSGESRRWNGRQIRNAFQTAIALAEYDFHAECKRREEIGETPLKKPSLEPRHFKSVAQTSAEFGDYLQSVMGGHSHKQKAQMREIRSDAWKDRGKETPTGKKYSMERAVRPSPSISKGTGMVREAEASSKSPTLKQPITSDAGMFQEIDSGEVMGDEEEYQLYLATEERKKKEEKEEKMKRFARRREQELAAREGRA